MKQEMLAERDWIVRDLHGRVIQRVFAAGLAMQTAAQLARNQQAPTRIGAVIGDRLSLAAQQWATVATR